MLNLKPTPGNLIIEPTEKETKTASGIYLPDNAGEKPQKGKVISVGNAVYQDGIEIKSPVKVGDTVFYKKWGGNEIKLDNKDFMIIKFEDVLAIEE